MAYDNNLGRPRGVLNDRAEVKQEPLSETHDLTVDESKEVDQVEVRAGDNRIDRPKCVPIDITACKESVEQEIEKNIANPDIGINDLLAPSKFETPDIIRSVTLKLVLAFIVALILLYVTSNAISIFRDIQVLPPPVNSILLVILTILIVFINYGIVKAIRFVLSLSNRSQLDMKQLHDAASFTSNRSFRIAKEDFLEPYIRTLRNRSSVLENSFIPPAELKGVLDSTERLLDSTRIISHREWVNEFIENVQEPMQAIATTRIKFYGKFVALKTAISPWPFIDILAVIYNSTLMISDIALVFNRKFSRGGTIRILLNLFFLIYISSEAQGVIDGLTDGDGQESIVSAATDGDGTESVAAIGSTVSQMAGATYPSIKHHLL